MQKLRSTCGAYSSRAQPCACVKWSTLGASSARSCAALSAAPGSLASSSCSSPLSASTAPSSQAWSSSSKAARWAASSMHASMSVAPGVSLAGSCSCVALIPAFNGLVGGCSWWGAAPWVQPSESGHPIDLPTAVVLALLPGSSSFNHRYEDAHRKNSAQGPCPHMHPQEKGRACLTAASIGSP